MKRKDLIKGSRIHAEIAKSGLLHDMNICLGNSLVNMYAKCGAFVKAHAVFDELPVQDVVSWNILIGEYAKYGHGKEALICYEEMRLNGICPTAVTFVFILKACGIIRETCKGQEIHYEVVRLGLLKKNCIVGNALVGMYAKCGELAKAQTLHDELSTQSLITWNALISGYAHRGRSHDALNCFEQMRSEGLSPDGVTFTCILKACANVGDVSKGKLIHDEVIRKGLLYRNVVLGTALVDMYAKCGLLVKAHEVLKELHIRDAVAWSALIAGYAQHEQGHEALQCFEQMQREGFSPDVVTFTSILKACGSTGDVDKGKEIHDEITRRGFLKKNILLGNALLDMYARCGSLHIAQEVLQRIQSREVITWNALLSGFIIVFMISTEEMVMKIITPVIESET